MRFSVLIVLAILTACTTPKYILKNEKTGQVVICGGNMSSSVAGGILGYQLQKSNDAECTNDYLKQDFTLVLKTE